MDAAWRLELLGPARLEIGGVLLTPERKAAAVLGYLAVEGPTPRSRLAGLLWPDSEEATARNNLTQTLRRLRLATQAEPVLGDNPVRLNDRFEVDVAALEQAALSGDAARLLRNVGGFLDGFDFDDCSEFELWLASRRERIAQWRTEAQASQVQELEARGAFNEALLVVQQMIADDPLAEAAYRTGMRLHYLAGDRGAALRLYGRCRDLLERELGVEPMPETDELAQRIEQGEVRQPAAQGKREAQIPLEIMRPPRLVGREREWLRMEQAWAAGKGILLSGPPGSGKSRLMRDFLATKGRTLQFSARPGDALVPYGTHARTYRQLHDRLMAEGVTVPAWITAELARIVPGLGPSPGPLDESGKLRFFQAKAEILRLAMLSGYSGMGFDDLHNIDMASVEAGSYALAQLRGADGEGFGTVHAFRSDELSPEMAAIMHQTIASDAFLLIELEPLPLDAVSALLESLELAPSGRLAESLGNYAGGNPLFVLETVKHLIETGGLEGRDLSAGLPLPSKVQEVIQRRLSGLSAAAMRSLQAAAVLGAEFDLEVIGSLLKMDPLDLIEPWQDLERAQILRGDRFSHDLIQETVHAELSPAVRTLLHRRAAEVLAERGGQPARIAHHWHEVGDPRRAAPWLLRAAEAAHHAFRHAEAAALYGRAGQAHRVAGERAAAFEAVYRQTTLLHGLHSDATLDQAVDDLFELATDDLQRALAWQGRCDALRVRGRAADLELAARSGLEIAETLDDPGPQTELTFSLAAALWLQGRVEETLAPLRAVLTRIESSPHRRLHAEVERWLGSSLSYLDRWTDADAYLLRAKALAEREGDRAKLAVVRSELGLNALRASDAVRASSELTAAWDILQGMEGVLDIKLASATMQASAWRARGRYDRALTVLDEAERLGAGTAFLDVGFVLLERARCLLDLGDAAGARDALDRAEVWPGLAETGGSLLATVRLDLLRVSGDPAAAEAVARKALALADTESAPGRRGPLLLALAGALPPSEALELANGALALAVARRAVGLEAAARTRKAQILLALGRPAEAAAETERAVAIVPAEGITQMTLPEIWLAHHQALSQGEPERAPEAMEALRAARAWLDDPCRGVPSDRWSAYVARHPGLQRIGAA